MDRIPDCTEVDLNFRSARDERSLKRQRLVEQK
jgi:hypothetical protein